MTLAGLLATAAVAVFSGLGQISMRWGGRGVQLRDMLSVQGAAEHPLWWIGLTLCWTCGLAWAWIVTRIPLGQAVPIYTGIFFISVALGSNVVLGETVGMRQWVGFVLIALGIAIAVGGTSVPPPGREQPLSVSGPGRVP